MLNENITAASILPILESISDAVFIDDADGYCRWCNSACEDMYNIEFEKIEGHHVDELEKMGIFTPSVTKRVLEEQRELTIIHENRFGKRLLTTGTPVFSQTNASTPGSPAQPRISMVITTSRDITHISSSKVRADATAKALLNVGKIQKLSEEDLSETEILASSEAMKNVMTLTKRLATVNSTVLITGESGVGKGLIASTLHNEGNRWRGPYVTVNCGAIPDNLIESELFGYVAGAFKLLQVIQERQITPVGATKPIPIDVRIISATNRNLEELVKEGKFREDLYYRLNVVPISVPPLRERPDDIIPLIHGNLAKFNRSLGENKSISSEALSILIKYPWPGNIRELQNIIERLIITTSHDVITDDDIFIFIKDAANKNTAVSTDLSLAAALDKAEKEILEQALETYKSTRALAKVLQVSQPTIVRKLNKHGLKSQE